MIPKEFISALSPSAIESMKLTKVPASFVIAEGALESGWGQSGLYRDAFNMFGVKADPSWKGDILTMNTRECIKGTWCVVKAKWRKYKTLLECVNDHAQFFLKNKRYAGCFAARDGLEFARGVAKAGYATDPQYAEKICSIIRQHDLLKFDEAGK
jgi:flagellum-specific peptidoglycan hydrolase FlgJ